MDIPLIDKVLKLLLVRYEVGEPVKKDPEQILIDIPYGEQDHELDVVLAPARGLSRIAIDMAGFRTVPSKVCGSANPV